jgi:hypothetical protein
VGNHREERGRVWVKVNKQVAEGSRMSMSGRVSVSGGDKIQGY